MNVLIISFYSYSSYSKGLMPEILQVELEKNTSNKYYFISCSKTFNCCYFNLSAQKHICNSCKFSLDNALDLIDGNFTKLRLADIIRDEHIQLASEFLANPSYKFSNDLRFENFDLGEAVLSTYISKTRDKELKNIKQNKYIPEIIKNVLVTYLAVKDFLAKENIELVYNFNGRQDFLRAMYRAAESLKINCINVERARPGGYLELYNNALPYSILSKKKLIDDFWETSRFEIEVKEKVASEFFELKRNGKETITKVYTGKQTKNFIPDEILNGRPCIVLFNSSDDEHAAVGDEYKNPFFVDQNEAILYLVEYFGKKAEEFNLVIRMHPNLSGIKFDYVHSIISLQGKYPNVFVFGPDHPIDTYSLIDIADKVVTFGSTVGLEANYWGKPVVLLGKGRYYYSDVAYLPKDVSEIGNMLKSKLVPKAKLNSLRFGFYYTKGGIKAKYYFQSGVFANVFFKGRNLGKLKLWQNLFVAFVKLKSKLLWK